MSILPCERCDGYYDTDTGEGCPHCEPSDLQDAIHDLKTELASVQRDNDRQRSDIFDIRHSANGDIMELQSKLGTTNAMLDDLSMKYAKAIEGCRECLCFKEDELCKADAKGFEECVIQIKSALLEAHKKARSSINKMEWRDVKTAEYEERFIDECRPFTEEQFEMLLSRVKDPDRTMIYIKKTPYKEEHFLSEYMTQADEGVMRSLL